jgi:hypothetical protein
VGESAGRRAVVVALRDRPPASFPQPRAGAQQRHPAALPKAANGLAAATVQKCPQIVRVGQVGKAMRKARRRAPEEAAAQNGVVFKKLCITAPLDGGCQLAARRLVRIVSLEDVEEEVAAQRVVLLAGEGRGHCVDNRCVLADVRAEDVFTRED